MKTSDKLLSYLAKYGPARVLDLAAGLNLTPADIRYHLKPLISAGLVKSVVPEPALSRGRPAARFEAVSRVPAENAFVLLELFSDQIISGFPDLSSEDIAAKVWKRIKKKLELSSSPYEKVKQILNFLDSIGVKTSWEAGEFGPNIIVIQNPYQTNMNPRTFHVLADSLVNLALQEAVKV